MKGSRREFLRAAGLTALGGAGLGVAGLRLARAEEHVEEALASGTRWAMVIDLPRWVQLDEATRLLAFHACHEQHNVPDFTSSRSPLPEEDRTDNQNHEIKWIWEEPFNNAFPVSYHGRLLESLGEAQVPVMCNHCERPPCVRVCPTQATWKREDGVVMMDMHRCIGCRYCIIACPYGSRSFNFRDPEPAIANIDHDYPTRMRGVVEKCSFCSELLGEFPDQMPYCVTAMAEALGDETPMLFGDLSIEDSPIRRALRERYTIRRKPELGTQPHVFYIVT